ncbi:type-F conjugative transfer system protein TraW [Moritella viscosa]|uniref:type-F conjugative transfer system protein TraW n=1 Tax=Moritella viscosa TaxID=80854 RepID=UPI0009164BC5|nr:type-F conjugative transfer system protein TraW [Moritella viscosa]SGZ09570.1 Conjugative transfer protein TraW [Moritella viscosa]
MEKTRITYLMVLLLSSGLLSATLLAPTKASAKDFGRVGATFEIGEIDMLQWINKRLKRFEANGKFDSLKNEFQGKVKAAVDRPTPVQGLGTTTEPNTFLVNPSLTLAKDIEDGQGNILYRKGTVVNPFDSSTWPTGSHINYTFNKTLIFIDGDDLNQQSWAKKFKQEKAIKWILTNGSPGEFATKVKTRVYFDQDSSITKRLHIQNTPSVVNQKGVNWEVREVDVSKEGF